MFYSKYSFNVALGSCFVKHFRNDTFDRNKTNKICHAPLYFFTQCIYGKRCKTLNYLHCASQKPSLSTMYVNFGLSIITSKVRQIISVMKTETLVFPEKLYFKNSSFWHFNSRFCLEDNRNISVYILITEII